MVDDRTFQQPTSPLDLPRSPDDFLIPKMIGPYKIEALLQKGGMNLLYLGTHPETKEPVTIKVLSQKFLSNPEMTMRFLNEAEIIGMTDHPNIIKRYGHGKWAGGLYIAMEFIQGISLRQYLLQTPLSLKRALEIILDIAYALCHLHTHGVIHRDLKPENVLVTESGMIKVIDFGIAQFLTDKQLTHPEEKQRLIGTPIYISPEQCENPENVSYPSDIYSLGIISYELILSKLSHGKIHIGLMPKGLQKIISKALQLNPADRYRDIVDFITDITAYLHSSTLQKERKVGDQLSELSENLLNAQLILCPTEPPFWPQVDVGIIHHKGLGFSGIYYDFLKLPSHSYGIILVECASKNSDSIIYTSILRGMVSTLCQQYQEPHEFVSYLNELLIKDRMKQVFNLSYLVLSPHLQKLCFISCGYGVLWLTPSGLDMPVKIMTTNHALGIDLKAKFSSTTHLWKTGDSLLISSTSSIFAELKEDKEAMERIFRQMLIDSSNQPPQKLVESLMRKIKFSLAQENRDHTVILIDILHN